MAVSGRIRFATLAGPLLVAATQIIVALWATAPAVAAPAVAAPAPDLSRLIGVQVDDAVEQLQGLKIRAELRPSTVPDGVDRSVVLVQDVVDISVEPGPTSEVRLVLGSRVPDLTGLPAAEAARVGGVSGLAVQRSPADALDSATVRGQRPASATLVTLGSPVMVRVVPVVSVPDIRRMSVADARATLEAVGLGLSLEQVGTGPDFGPVVAQRPDAGSVVDVGSTVTARVEAVADPPVLVTVPTVIGLGPVEVGRTLEASGLVLSSTTAGAAVVAVEQSPAAGSRVERGSQVIVQFGPTVPPSTAATSTAGPVPGGSSPAGSQSPVSSQSDATVLWLAVLAAALAATAVAGVRRARVRRHPGSQRPDVRGHPSPGTPTLTELGPPVRTRLRLVPHQDRGTQTFEEARHD